MPSIVRQLEYLYFAYLSRPSSDRVLYRTIRKAKQKRILQIGVGVGDRGQRMIEVAALAEGPAQVVYVGVDAFELRAEQDGPGMSLKQAHKRYTATGARVRLLPGDPFSALARTANELGTFDLILIAADQPRDALGRAWFYVPRLLHERTQVLLEEPLPASGTMFLRPVQRAEIDQLAGQGQRRRAAA
jgi:hypothetical protein